MPGLALEDACVLRWLSAALALLVLIVCLRAFTVESIQPDVAPRAVWEVDAAAMLERFRGGLAIPTVSRLPRFFHFLRAMDSL